MVIFTLIFSIFFPVYRHTNTHMYIHIDKTTGTMQMKGITENHKEQPMIYLFFSKLYACCNWDTFMLKTNSKRQSFHMAPWLRLCVTKTESDLVDLKYS